MIGCEIRRFESCESTNDEAARWARDIHDRAPHGAVVVAESQAAGRGRQGRRWHSPPGENLYFSCVLRPTISPQKVPPMTICAGLAVCEVVNGLGVAASIKWPNDVLVREQKLAGVLTEMSTRAQHLDSVIVGVGVNVNTLEFPEDLDATSLQIETGVIQDRPKVLAAILFAMNEWVERYCKGGIAALKAEFDSNNGLAGQEVRARVGGALVTGRVVSLGEDGSLVIADASGNRHQIISGEVERRESLRAKGSPTSAEEQP